MLPEFSWGEVSEALAAMQSLRVAVVGETIVDEYAFCDAIGKSGKEPTLVTRFARCEAQAGGALAVANHVAGFAGEVELVSSLGSIDSRESFIREALAPNVTASLVTKSDTPTLIKRRYVDTYTGAKLLGVYTLDTTPMAGEDLAALHSQLETALETADVVVVADYGHGLIPPAVVAQLCRGSKFLAVNTQLNAANRGYNVLSKYPRADYACLHEGELRLDARDLTAGLGDLIRAARTRLGARAVMATLGKSGTWLSTESADLRCPALASRVVERVGAGDAVLAVSALAIAAGVRSELVGVFANLAGAQAVAQLGNHAAISKTALCSAMRELASPTREAV